MNDRQKILTKLQEVLAELNKTLGKNAKFILPDRLKFSLIASVVNHPLHTMLEVRPHTTGLISLTVARYAPLAHYYFCVQNEIQKDHLQKICHQAHIRSYVKIGPTAELINKHQIEIPDLVMLNRVSENTVQDDFNVLDLLGAYLQNCYKPIVIFANLKFSQRKKQHDFIEIIQNKYQPFVKINPNLIMFKLDKKT